METVWLPFNTTSKREKCSVSFGFPVNQPEKKAPQQETLLLGGLDWFGGVPAVRPLLGSTRNSGSNPETNEITNGGVRHDQLSRLLRKQCLNIFGARHK